MCFDLGVFSENLARPAGLVDSNGNLWDLKRFNKIFTNLTYSRSLLDRLYLNFIGDFVPKRYSSDDLDELRWLALDEYLGWPEHRKLVDKTSCSQAPVTPYSNKKKVAYEGTHKPPTFFSKNPYGVLFEEEFTIEEDEILHDWEVYTTPDHVVHKDVKPNTVEYLTPHIQRYYNNFDPNGPLETIELELTYARDMDDVRRVIYNKKYDHLPDEVLEYPKTVDRIFTDENVKWRFIRMAQMPALKDFACFTRRSVEHRVEPPELVTVTYTIGAWIYREAYAKAILGKEIPRFTDESLSMRIMLRRAQKTKDFAEEMNLLRQLHRNYGITQIRNIERVEQTNRFSG